jgi:hypothetical protein
VYLCERGGYIISMRARRFSPPKWRRCLPGEDFDLLPARATAAIADAGGFLK